MEPPPPKRRRLSIADAAQNITPKASCILEQFQFSETVNTDVLEQLREAGFLRKTREQWEVQQDRLPEETHLMKWAKKIKNHTAKVRYKRAKHKFGRVQPRQSQSLGVIRREVRWATCGEDYVDIDVQNCHPCMLLQICRALDIPCHALANYVENRSQCLSEVQPLFKHDLPKEDVY